MVDVIASLDDKVIDETENKRAAHRERDDPRTCPEPPPRYGKPG
jgi:hypothetical protein